MYLHLFTAVHFVNTYAFTLLTYTYLLTNPYTYLYHLDLSLILAVQQHILQ